MAPGPGISDPISAAVGAPSFPAKAGAPVPLTIAAALYGLCILITFAWFIMFVDCEDCVFTDLAFFGIETAVLGPFALWWMIARKAPAEFQGLQPKLDWATASYLQRLLEDEELRTYQTTAQALIAGSSTGQAHLRARSGKIVGAAACGVALVAGTIIAIAVYMEVLYMQRTRQPDAEFFEGLVVVVGLLAAAGLVGMVLLIRSATRSGRQGRQQVAADMTALQDIEFKVLQRARDKTPVAGEVSKAAASPRVTYRRYG